MANTVMNGPSRNGPGAQASAGSAADCPAASVRPAMTSSSGHVSHWLRRWIQWYPKKAMSAATVADRK